MDQSRWPEYQEKLTHVFKTKTRDEWTAIMEGSDVCFAPVLALSEVAEHPHNKARGTFQELDGLTQPAPAPRFSRTGVSLSHASRAPGQDSQQVLLDAGYDAEAVAEMIRTGAVSIPE